MKKKAIGWGMVFLLTLQAAVSAWASETNQEDKMVVETQSEANENILTLEEALEKAKKNSADLRSVEETAEYLQELKEDIYDSVGSFTIPDASYQKWVNDRTYSLYSSVQSILSNMTKNRYTEEITNIALESTVKSHFTSILSNESALALAKRTEELQKMTYEQGKVKFDYGIISKYDLQQMENSYTEAKEKVASLEKTLTKEYRSFYDLIGEKEEAEYTLVYDVSYEPYTMSQTMNQYISERLKKDYTILQKEQAVEDAKFSMNYMSESTTNNQYLANEHSYEESKRSLKTAKEDKELAIKNAYDAILELEDSYVSAENNLEIAKSDLALAELNYELGRITQIELQQAELAVEQAEDALQQIVYAHDLQIYQFENTELL